MSETRKTNEDRITETKAMIEADTKHLIEALARGDRQEARNCVDSIIDLGRALQDM